MSEIPMVENYNPKKITIGKVEDKAIRFYYKLDDDNFEKIRFQIPKMKIAFDIDERKSKTGHVFVKNVSLSTNEIGSDNNRKRIEILRNKLEKTEKYIKKLLPNHLQNKTFVPSLWQGKNTSFKPIFKVSINYDHDGKTKTGSFDSDNNPVDDSFLVKGQMVSMAIRLEKVWVWNDKIGINWEIEQVKIYDKPTKIDSLDKPKKKFMIRKG